MKRKTAVFAILLVLALAAMPLHVKAQQQIEPQEVVTIKLPNYNLGTPVQISVTYTYTQSYNINVSTFTQPHHQAITEPTGITFKTNEPDVYNINIQVRYDVWVNQTITLTLFEANQTGKMIEFSIFSKGFDINLVISAFPPQTYPTVDEISSNIWNRFRNEMQEFLIHEQRISGALTDANLFIGALAAVSFAGLMATIVVLAYLMRRTARTEALVRRKTNE